MRRPTADRRPRWVDIVDSPVFRAVNSKPTPDADLRAMQAGELLALAEFEAGTAAGLAWHDLDDMTRVALELARVGIGPEVMPVAVAAAQALRSVQACQGGLRIDPCHLVHLRDLQAAHDQQRRLATRAEFIAANMRALQGLLKAGDRRTVPTLAQQGTP